MRRGLRWLRRGVLGLLAVAVVAVLAAVITLHSAWGREQVRAQLEAKLRPYFPAGARIGRLEGSVLGDFTLVDLELRDREGRPAVTIARVHLNVGLASWLDGTGRLEHLIIEGVAIELHQRASDPPNVATMFQPNPDPLTFDVAIDHLVVRDATVALERGGQIEHLDGLTVDGQVGVTRAGAARVRAEVGARWRERGAAVTLSTQLVLATDGAVAVGPTRLAVGAVILTAGDVTYRGGAVRGGGRVVAPTGAVAALVPGWAVPTAALDLQLDVAPGTGDTIALGLRGRAGAGAVQGALAVQPRPGRPVVAGTLMLRGLDVGAAWPTRPPLPETALDVTVMIAVELVPARDGLAVARGTLAVSGAGRVESVRFDQVQASAHLDGVGGAALVVAARGAGDTRVRGALTATQDGAALVLRDGTLTAHTAALERASQGAMALGGALGGALDVDLGFSGRLDATGPTVAVRGTIAGRRLRRADLRLASLDVRLALDDVPGRPGGDATLTARGLRVGAIEVPTLGLTARGRRGGGYAVRAHAEAPALELAGTALATVTLGDLVERFATIEVARATLRVGRTELAVRGGRVVVDRARIAVDGVRGDVGGAAVALDGVIGLGRPGDVRGELAISGLDLARVRGLPGMPPTVRGVLDVHAGLARRRAHLELALRDPVLGTVTAALDVVPPARPTVPAAWTALDRRAVRALRVEAKAVDVAAVGVALGVIVPMAGTIDGHVQLGADVVGRPGAELHGHGLVAAGLPVPLDLDVVFDLDAPGVTRFDVTAVLRTLGQAHGSGAIRVPLQVFDLAAWRRVGLGGIADARARVDIAALDGAVATWLGLGDLHGAVTAELTAAPGLRTLTATVVARDVRGGPLVAPAGITVQATADAGGARATATATLDGAVVATATFGSPRDVLALIRAGLDLGALPVRGEITVPDAALATLGRAVGQRGLPSGRVQGRVTVAGTLATPTADAAITITDLGARPRRGTRPARGGLRVLTVTGRYAAGAVHVVARGQQADGGALAIDADVDPTRPAATRATVVATRVMLGPLARLLPDVLFGVDGVLDADLRLRGLDPATATVLGTLHLTRGTLPIHDVVGVLRDASVTLAFTSHRVHAAIDGAIESGRLEIVGDATLDGLLPQRGTLDATVRGLELITATAPRLDGTLHAEANRVGERWKIDARLRDATVTGRAAAGRVLHPSGLPLNLAFGDSRPGAPVAVPRGAQVRSFVGAEPDAPFIELALRIEPVTVVTPLLRGEVSGHLDVDLGLDGATVDGKLEIARGDIAVYGRRYRLRRAQVTFDGTVNPLLDVQVERDLPQLTLFASVTGRASDPRIRFSSDPATYTEGQLLAFAIADTAAAAGTETSEAATNLFATVVSQAVVGAITPLLPVRLDVIAYEPPSASGSRAFVFGRWVTRKLLVLYRNRAEARTGENVNEAEVEYWLDRNVLIEGVAGDRTVLGLDLLWSRRW